MRHNKSAVIYRTKPPRAAKEGKPLSTVVANSSNAGSWEGQRGGVENVGFEAFRTATTDSLGRQTIQTGGDGALAPRHRKRAYIKGGVVIAAFAAVGMLAVKDLAEAIRFGHTMKIAYGSITVVVIAIGLLSLLIMWRVWAELVGELDAEQAGQDSLKEQVYDRLRYVEQDHIVFDPETGFEIAADRRSIMPLIDAIVGERLGETQQATGDAH